VISTTRYAATNYSKHEIRMNAITRTDPQRRARAMKPPAFLDRGAATPRSAAQVTTTRTRPMFHAR
jgi:hypothetical protein